MPRNAGDTPNFPSVETDPRPRRRVLSGVSLVALATATTLFASDARAANTTYYITSGSDSGAGTLRNDAAAAGSTDIITVPYSYSYNKTSAQLTTTLTSALTLNSGVTVNGGSTYSSFYNINGSQINISNATLESLNIGSNIGVSGVLKIAQDYYGNFTQINGNISGSGSLNVSSYSAYLYGANTYTGGTVINSGAVLYGNSSSAFGSGAITLSRGSLSVAPSGFTLNNAITLTDLSGGAGGGNIIGATGGNLVVAGPISGTGYLNLAYNVKLTGNNTYSGGTILSSSSGTNVQVSQDSNLGASTGGLSLDGGTLENIASFTLGAGRTVTVGAYSGTGTLSNDAGTTLTVNSTVTGTGGLIKTGAGTTVLAGLDQYTGSTTVSAGTLQLSGTGSFGNGTRQLSIAGGATASLNGVNSSAGSINGAGNITLGSGTLTTGASNAADSFSGVISGTGGLVKVGTATQTLSGTNLYTGGTTVNSGTLAISSDANLGGASGGLTLNNFGAVENTASFTLGRGIHVGGVGTITNDTGTTLQVTGIISGGSIDKTGAGTTVLAAQNTYSGITQIAAGTLRLSGSGTFGNGSGQLVLGGGSATADLNGVSTGVGSINGSGTITLGTATLTTGKDNSDSTFSGSISGSGGLVKTGTGTQALTGTSSYTGATQISGGTLAIGGGATMANGAVTVSTGATLDVSAGAASQQVTTLNSSGGGINLGSNAIAVSNSYTNSNFGSGNSFNARAGITGTGLIDATGNAALAVTGAQIVNGTGTTPTLALGNIHVGGTTSASYQIADTGTSGPTLIGAIQTSVNGGSITDSRLSGSGVTAGNFTLAPSSSTGAYAVKLTAGSQAGALSGQSVELVNNFGNVANQTLAITGAVYNYAAAALDSTTVALGNYRVGMTAAQSLGVSNTAAAGAYSEKLDATVGGVTGSATGTGSASLVAAGTASSALSVGLNTSSAGAKSGAVTLQLTSDGTGTSGLGNTALANQTVQVSGTVYRLAQGQTAPDSVVFGNAHLGDVRSQTLAVSNTAATDGYSEKLNATLTTAGAAAGSGTVSLIAAGATNRSLVVGLDTGTAGARIGTATVAYASDGTGTSGYSAIANGSQAIAVSGAVYRYAAASTSPTDVNFGAYRVGDSAAGKSVSLGNTAAADGYSEGLKVTTGAAPTGYAVSGPSGIIAAGSQGTANLSLSTATAGTFNGTLALSMVSSGDGTSGLGDTALGTQNLSLNGKVYAAATAAVQTSPVDFGIVHLGDKVAAQTLSVANSSAVQGLNDILTGDIGTVDGPFSASGALSGVAAGTSDSASLMVGLDTNTAGKFIGTAGLNLFSHNSDMADLALDPASVNLFGQVNAYASAGFTLAGGAGLFSGTGSNYELDLGTMTFGSQSTSLLDLFNFGKAGVSSAYTDALAGSFTMANDPLFDLAGFGAFSDLVAGQDLSDLTVSFLANKLGTVSEQITFAGRSTDANYDGSIGDITLTLTADVVAAPVAAPGNVPEPSALLLLAPAFGWLRWRRRRSASAAVSGHPVRDTDPAVR